jgi:arylsulfatase A-like enzyme
MINFKLKAGLMRKMIYLAAAVNLGMLSAPAHTNAQNPESKGSKLNVILLMADDLGYGDVGFNGNKKIITPHLDQMAAAGIVFTRFYAAAPLCSPTRASVLTGRNPFRQGIFAAHTGGMRPAEKTIAELVKAKGYETGFFGKWHLGWVEPDDVETRGFYSPPWHHGFDEVFATKSAVPTWNPTKTPEGWDGFGSREDGSWGGSVYVHNGRPVTENLDGDDSRIIMDRAIPFMEEAIKNEKPFFATIWFHAPHEPIVAGPGYLAKYPGLPEEQQHLYGCITAMDEQIGRLRQFLKKHGIAENTVVFFCSDNGPADPQVRRGIASAGPFRGHKHQMWEGGLRVPSLVEWPGTIKASQKNDFLSGTVDYLPTILDLLNLPPVSDRPIDGISLKPVLLGQPLTREVPIASGYQRLYQNNQLFALIHNQFKICIPDKGEQMMLFDILNDPGETTDLASQKPEIFEKMKSELEEIKTSWLKSREGGDYIW